MSILAKNRSRRPTVADLVAAAETSAPTEPVSTAELTASSLVESRSATKSKVEAVTAELIVPSFDDGDLVEDGLFDDPNWIWALADFSEGCPVHGGHHVEWWEHKLTGEMRCVECWRAAPPLRSLVARFWVSSHYECVCPTTGRPMRQWLFATLKGYSKWPWVDALTEQAAKDREEFWGKG